jgi:antitoxin component YwqK of YwqJK toxin-antitoxin module
MSAPPVAAKSTPIATQGSSQLADAGVPTPDARAAPRLTCTNGATAIATPYPDPTWHCTRGDGVRHGPFITLYPDHQIEISGSYVDGKLDGAWERRHSNGAIAESGTYVAGLRDGVWRQLGESGNVLGEYTLARGTGQQKRWLADGMLYSETMLKDGVADGATKIYERNAVVVAENRRSGVLDGKRVGGTKNLVRVDETYVRGKRRGARTIWQWSVLISNERYDTNGELDGAFKQWRKARTPRVVGAYSHGKRTGAWTWTDRKNKKEREGTFAADKRTGTWTEWLDGVLFWRGEYADGKLVGDHVYYDRNGSELGRSSLPNGNGTLLTFHANKRVATKTAYVGGLKEGAHEEFSSRGKPLVQGRHLRDDKHGVWRELTETGELVLETTFKRGKLDGTWKKFDLGKLAAQATYKDGSAEGAYTEYRNGKQSLVGQFTADRRSGTWTAYDANGSVTLIATYQAGVLDGPWRQLVAGTVVEGTMSGGRRTGTWTQTDRAGQTTRVTYSTP